MKRLVLFLWLACIAAIASPTVTFAQDTPQPTPTPDWHVYDDPAMHFRAPDGFFPVGQRHLALGDLSQDSVVVAGWIYPNKDHPRRLVIEQAAFDGDVDGWESVYENQLRDQFDNPFFKDKTDTKLRNGMPAKFLEMTTGEGFSVQKFYMLIWADGERGVALLLQTKMDDISALNARVLLSDATAVRYPVESP
ncbi:MAG TPA: hypothetical protein VMA98_07755 [Candidatus Acidoferrales bacterium]|nr:hypothetical protein [Candidatus Acidoferrales bacterium]